MRYIARIDFSGSALGSARAITPLKRRSLRYAMLSILFSVLYVYNNDNLQSITNTCSIANFCKMQHLKYVAHVTRLDNNSFQKQLLFSTDHKKYTRNRWIKMEKDLCLIKCRRKNESPSSIDTHH